MRSVPLLLLMLLPLIAMWRCRIDASAELDGGSSVARDAFERTMMNLLHQRRMFMDGFGNATEVLQNGGYGFEDSEELEATGEGRGRRKRLRQMNRTLMAIIMAYTLKFMFLIPTFVGTLILLKFTTALAGFFYALFAAILGLDHHQHHH